MTQGGNQFKQRLQCFKTVAVTAVVWTRGWMKSPSPLTADVIVKIIYFCNTFIDSEFYLQGVLLIKFSEHPFGSLGLVLSNQKNVCLFSRYAV